MSVEAGQLAGTVIIASAFLGALQLILAPELVTPEQQGIAFGVYAVVAYLGFLAATHEPTKSPQTAFA